MRFTCTRDNLKNALDLTTPLAGKHAHLPILGNVLIQASESKVEFISTNLEVAIRAQVRARVDEVGAATVPARMLAESINLLNQEQVEIVWENGQLQLGAGASKTKIKGLPADEFPVLPQIEEDHAYVLAAKPLREALTKTVVAVSKNEIRPELSGVLFSFLTERYSGLMLAATDSYRLAEARVPVVQGADAEIKCIVPGRVAYELTRLLGTGGTDGEQQVRLWVSQNQIAIRFNNFEMTARLIQGRYPDYAQIIPNSFKTLASFPVAQMSNKIKAASMFTAAGVNAVSFAITNAPGTVKVSATNAQTGEHTSEIDAEVTGDANAILLNHRYVLDGLQHIDTDSVEFGVNNADAPCVLRPKGNSEFLYIVMPIRQ